MQVSLDDNTLLSQTGEQYDQILPDQSGVFKAAIVLNESQIIKELFVNYNKETNKVKAIIEKNNIWRDIKQGISQIYFHKDKTPIDYGNQDLSSKRDDYT